MVDTTMINKCVMGKWERWRSREGQVRWSWFCLFSSFSFPFFFFEVEVTRADMEGLGSEWGWGA